MYNPAKMQNWPIRDFLIAIALVQLAFWNVVLFDTLGINIPIVRQIIPIIYLMVLPGMIVLRILGLFDLDATSSLLYSVGISISIVMLVGLFTNQIYPRFGISSPISLLPLVITISIVVIVLSALCYLRTVRPDCDIGTIKIKEFFTPYVIVALFLPVMSILGTQAVNIYGMNNILLILIITIAIIILLVDLLVPVRYHPLFIWALGISVLWHITLITPYIHTGDCILEYYYSMQTLNNSIWDGSFDSYSSVLSVGLCMPIYSILCDLDLTWSYKILVPFLLSLIPLGLYKLSLILTEDKSIALFSPLLFISAFPFFKVLPTIAKQGIAELFLILLALLFVTQNIIGMKRSVILLLFSTLLIVSHYGVSYLFLFALILAILLIKLDQSMNISNKITNLMNYVLNLNLDSLPNKNLSAKEVSSLYVMFVIVLAILWYVFISNSLSFNQLVYMGKFVYHNITTQLFFYDSSRGINLITKDLGSPLGAILRYLYFLFQFFIVIGILELLFHRKKYTYTKTYFIISAFFILVLITAIVQPIAGAMDPRRLFHLALIFLAPVSIVGGLKIFETVIKCLNKSIGREYNGVPHLLMSLTLTIFFLFNVGFIYEIANENQNSLAISQKSMTFNNDINCQVNYYISHIELADVYSGRWLTANMQVDRRIYRGNWIEGYPSLTIYADRHGNQNKVPSRFTTDNIFEINPIATDSDGYVQVTKANLVGNVGWGWNNALQQVLPYRFSEIFTQLEPQNKIYCNGGSQILDNYDLR